MYTIFDQMVKLGKSTTVALNWKYQILSKNSELLSYWKHDWCLISDDAFV